jgi:hypothetical protein
LSAPSATIMAWLSVSTEDDPIEHPDARTFGDLFVGILYQLQCGDVDGAMLRLGCLAQEHAGAALSTLYPTALREGPRDGAHQPVSPAILVGIPTDSPTS